MPILNVHSINLKKNIGYFLIKRIGVQGVIIRLMLFNFEPFCKFKKATIFLKKFFRLSVGDGGGREWRELQILENSPNINSKMVVAGLV
jgi:hypothetical protein